MATTAPVSEPIVVSPAAGAGSIAGVIDRWIYVFMAAMLIVFVLTGFLPDSRRLLAGVAAGERPPIPWLMHMHAVSMGSWLLLLLAQTTLMATGRRSLHMQLGILGAILAPVIVLTGLFFVPTNLRIWVAFGAGASPEVQQAVEGYLHVMTNIALIQTRIAVCFLGLVVLGLRARKRDSGLHKRLMILATTVPMPAAFDRMEFLPSSLPASPLTADLWPLLAIAPMFAWDVFRMRKIHRAYWIWAAFMVPSGIVINLLWDDPWWHSVAPGMLYGG